MTDRVAAGIPESVTDRVAAGIPESVTDRVAAGIPESVTDRVAAGIPESVTDRVAAGIPESVTDRVAAGIPESVTDRVAAGIPESVTDRVAAGIPGNDRCRRGGPRLWGSSACRGPASTASKRHSAPSFASHRASLSTKWLMSRCCGSPSPHMPRWSGSRLPHRVECAGLAWILSGPRSLHRPSTLAGRLCGGRPVGEPLVDDTAGPADGVRSQP